jgi:hypothetical protein
MKNLIVSTIAGLVLVSGAFAGEVDWRQHEQQQRIAQGVRNGSLTQREAARLERQEARLRQEISCDRYSNGHLTPGEYRSINRQENRLSDEIYRYKHNESYR